MTTAPTTTPYTPRSYRLTRPDGLGFFRRRTLAQFVLGCLGLGLGLLAVVVTAAGTDGRVVFAGSGTLVLGVALGRTPSGEELIDVLGPLARYLRDGARGRHRYAAALAPVGEEPPPLFAGLSVLELDAETLAASGCGASALRLPGSGMAVIFDRADGSVSVVLRVHGDGFLLADDEERDARVEGFGRALASLGRDGGAITRVSWSHFVKRAAATAHLAYLDAAARSDPQEELRDSYLDLVTDATAAAIQSDVLITLTTRLERANRAERSVDPLVAAALRLHAEAGVFADECARAGLVAVGPLGASALGWALRERLDPAASSRLGQRAQSLGATAGVVGPHNLYPLAIEERRQHVVADETLHQVFRVAEWPRTAVRADWLASFLCEASLTRSFTVSFAPQPRRLARRQALAVATRVGANIDERQTKGRRVGAEERRAMLAAEALDEELEAGAAMELLVGLVDVTASDERELREGAERLQQHAASIGMELRRVDFRHGEALVCALPLGRLVTGRAR